MGWFFYKGGCYFHDNSLSETIAKGCRRLLVPYLCFSVLAIFLEVIIHGLLGNVAESKSIISEIPITLKREGAVSCNAPLWFLISLFFVRVFYAFFIRIRIPVLLISVISLICAFSFYRANLPIGLYFENISLGLFFFSTGYFLRNRQYNEPVFYSAAAFFILFLIYFTYLCKQKEY